MSCTHSNSADLLYSPSSLHDHVNGRASILFHDLLYSVPVGFAQMKVALSCFVLISHVAHPVAGCVTHCFHSHLIIARVQYSPIVTIGRWKKSTRETISVDQNTCQITPAGRNSHNNKNKHPKTLNNYLVSIQKKSSILLTNWSLFPQNEAKRLNDITFQFRI